MPHSTPSFTVSAEAHSDDRNVEVNFDAVAWLANASDAAIAELVGCDCGGDYPADRVATDLAATNLELDALFVYLDLIKDDPSKQDYSGFECHVDEEELAAWLKTERPALYAQLAPQRGWLDLPQGD